MVWSSKETILLAKESCYGAAASFFGHMLTIPIGRMNLLNLSLHNSLPIGRVNRVRYFTNINRVVYFWKGSLRVISQALPFEALRFGLFPIVTERMKRIDIFRENFRPGVLFLSALLSTTTTQILLHPFETVISKSTSQSFGTRVHISPSKFAAASSSIFRMEGLIGFYKLFNAKAAPALVFNTAYLGGYHVMCLHSTSWTSKLPAALLVSFLGILAQQPFEVVRRQLEYSAFAMTGSMHQHVESRVWPLTIATLRKEGLAGLFSGVRNKKISIFKAAIVILFYDSMHQV